MSAALLLAALGAGCCAVLLATGPPRAPSRRRLDRGAPNGHGPGPSAASTARTDSPPAPLVRASAVLAALAVAVVVGGVPGIVVGALVGLGLPVVVAGLEPASARRRRLSLVRSGPLVADLLAAALSAGVPLERALPVVAHAVGGPAAELLREVDRRCQLGEPAAAAWGRLRGEPGLGGVARAVARSARTGAPVTTLLSDAAVELRGEAEAAALARVRATGVRAVLPLGLCLLPAFALLGIAPMVGGFLPRW